MAYCELRFGSGSLEKQESMNVLLPDGGDGPFPVLYLLHGLSDDYTIWQRRTSIERYVAGLPLIVVIPDGRRSFYCNTPTERYEDHITKDVVDTIDRTFNTIRSPRGRAIAGLSMGGYGAVMLALRHPEIFSVACSHSGAVFFCHEPLNLPGHEYDDMFAATLPKGKYDCYKLAAKRKKDRKLPALKLDCGTEDFLLMHNRRFRAYLDKIGVPHDYAEFPGAHEWNYWDNHIRQTLEFVMKRLKK
jgi:putative tributyrin esterase